MEGVGGTRIAENGPLFSSRVTADPRFNSALLGALEGVGSLVCVPLNFPSQSVGLVYVDRLNDNLLGAFRQRELNLLAVLVNCAALPETLLESELFGYAHGAFTGAVRDKVGLFEEADGGTIFLDEIEKVPESVQAKLLHVLDRSEIRPVGATRSKKVDARVICATGVDLRERIKEGRFLEDLYYRLNDITVRVPALRERREDIPVLAQHFLTYYARQ